MALTDVSVAKARFPFDVTILRASVHLVVLASLNVLTSSQSGKKTSWANNDLTDIIRGAQFGSLTLHHIIVAQRQMYAFELLIYSALKLQPENRSMNIIFGLLWPYVSHLVKCCLGCGVIISCYSEPMFLTLGYKYST